jgi:hypothetical protein
MVEPQSDRREETPHQGEPSPAEGPVVPPLAEIVADLKLPYRPDESRAVSILPADRDLGLAECRIQTDKSKRDAGGTPFTQTVVEADFYGSQYVLTLDYIESQSRPDALRATLSINGSHVSDSGYPGRGAQFPFVVREDETASSEVSGLKGVVMDIIEEFRRGGDKAVLSLIDRLAKEKEQEEVRPSLEYGYEESLFSKTEVQAEPPAPSREFTLIGSIFDLTKSEFQRLGDMPGSPTVSFVPGVSDTLRLAIAYPNGGPAMHMEIQPLRANEQAEQTFLVRTVELTLPGQGWKSKLPFFEGHERYSIDAAWRTDRADLSGLEGQMSTLVRQYNRILKDYLNGELGKIDDYFSSLYRFNRAFPNNWYSRVTNWSRGSSPSQPAY